MIKLISKIVISIKIKFVNFFYAKKIFLQFKKNFYLKKKYSSLFLKNTEIPKVFLIKNVVFDQNIYNLINNYRNKNPINEYSYHGHKDTYQSLHDLNKDKNFKNFFDLIKNIVENKILQFYSLEKTVNIVTLWFVITKTGGNIKKHNHGDGEISFVLYLKNKTNNPHKNSGQINIFNYARNIDFYLAESPESIFVKKNIKKKILIHRPIVGDLIFFDSYLDHSVTNTQKIIDERISIAGDIDFDFEKN